MFFKKKNFLVVWNLLTLPKNFANPAQIKFHLDLGGCLFILFSVTWIRLLKCWSKNSHLKNSASSGWSSPGKKDSITIKVWPIVSYPGWLVSEWQSTEGRFYLLPTSHGETARERRDQWRVLTSVDEKKSVSERQHCYYKWKAHRCLGGDSRMQIIF